MDNKRIEEAVMQADEVLRKMLNKNNIGVYDTHGSEYAQAVASLAGRILLADKVESSNDH